MHSAGTSTTPYTDTDTALNNSKEVVTVDRNMHVNMNVSTTMSMTMSESITYNANNSNDRESPCSSWNDMLDDIVISICHYLDVPSIVLSVRQLNKHWSD